MVSPADQVEELKLKEKGRAWRGEMKLERMLNMFRRCTCPNLKLGAAYIYTT